MVDNKTSKKKYECIENKDFIKLNELEHVHVKVKINKNWIALLYMCKGKGVKRNTCNFICNVNVALPIL